ncbi:hypothetical protein ASPWEDRAFT_56175 [Aspergillus wentii DTO 134E9]|uniref:RGS domain-containing protein n=1 Tax=Aspergillus wentii DTO 134E9 TaxID=1073089 RepID=A0A1L9S156_ASPWE|nr:uncharacterized protein ASPWEDRAFT_56175 [Aspergillus wentii DTO 134E9]KAI9931101.1 hypothetical protein MW887_010758 [Aspergillus wentii]OJJ40900.1 hypothetical protein ASPWEDRAFT_56175 [Aspergillus wentii DTO 134E9]
MGSELGVSADSKAEAVYSPVAIWWACWAGIWTVAVASGITYLVLNRNSPTLRIRGIGLSLSAVVFIHLYFMSVQFGIMAGPLLPGDAEFWLMGTYLPCGIVLFQASNTRFLHVAKLQKKYAHRDSRIDLTPDLTPKPGLKNRFNSLSFNMKTFICVGIAWAVQLFLTVLMWLISRKWHSSWGIPGTEVHGTEMEQKYEMGRGWEWWPTIVCQFVWSWIVAPIVLWKARHIHDTQGWRTQTIGCVVSSLHATPMWLIGVYVPGMAPVNAVWLPPQWICLSIIFIEIFAVFLPCWEVMRSQTLRKETLDSIAQWELKTKGIGSDRKSLASASTVVESFMSGFKSANGSVESDASREGLMSMSALEYVLERNPAPLQQFSALHDFSGENIAFLTSLADWKTSLPKDIQDGTALADENSRELIRERFNRALYIYAEFISVRHAEFPVNISSQDLRRLETIFEGPARIMYGDEREVDSVTPFDTPGYNMQPLQPTESEGSTKAFRSTVAALRDRVQYWGDVPDEFDLTVFDAAEESIKYLVLTNTWPRFIKSRRVSSDSTVTLRSGMTAV